VHGACFRGTNYDYHLFGLGVGYLFILFFFVERRKKKKKGDQGGKENYFITPNKRISISKGRDNQVRTQDVKIYVAQTPLCATRVGFQTNKKFKCSGDGVGKVRNLPNECGG